MRLERLLYPEIVIPTILGIVIVWLRIVGSEWVILPAGILFGLTAEVVFRRTRTRRTK